LLELLEGFRPYLPPQEMLELFETLRPYLPPDDVFKK